MCFVIFPNRLIFLIKFILGSHSKKRACSIKGQMVGFSLPSLGKRTWSRQRLAEEELSCKLTLGKFPGMDWFYVGEIMLKQVWILGSCTRAQVELGDLITDSEQGALHSNTSIL